MMNLAGEQFQPSALSAAMLKAMNNLCAHECIIIHPGNCIPFITFYRPLETLVLSVFAVYFLNFACWSVCSGAVSGGEEIPTVTPVLVSLSRTSFLFPFKCNFLPGAGGAGGGGGGSCLPAASAILAFTSQSSLSTPSGSRAYFFHILEIIPVNLCMVLKTENIYM